MGEGGGWGREGGGGWRGEKVDGSVNIIKLKNAISTLSNCPFRVVRNTCST